MKIFKITLMLILVGIPSGLLAQQSDVDTSTSFSTQLRKISIKSQPDAPLLLRDLSVIFNPDGAGHPTTANGGLDITFHVKNMSGKTVKSFTYIFREPEGKDEQSVSIWQKIAPYASVVLDKGSVFVDGRPLILSLEHVEFRDGTEWVAAPFPFKFSEKQKQKFVIQ